MIPRTLSWILHANYKPVLSAVNEFYFRFANDSEKEHAPMRGAGSALFQDTLQGCDADRFAGATGRSSESPEDRPAPERTGRCGLCGRARLPQRPTMMPAPALFADAVRSRRGNEAVPVPARTLADRKDRSIALRPATKLSSQAPAAITL
jgi:hypothetical protein